MGIDNKDRQLLNSILSEMNAVISEIDSIKGELRREYQTVGGEFFEKPFDKLVTKLEKAKKTLNRID